MSADPVRLVVVGHTNTGKTSLLRTLTRDTRFGEVSDRPSTTREVSRVDLLADGCAQVSLFDTPGLEDPMGLLEFLGAQARNDPDPVAVIDAFLNGDHDAGRYEQEAKVLRQLRRSDAALVVIDVREPVLARHREELRLLSQCGRPLLPVLNFLGGTEARTPQWREAISRLGLHVSAEFDTVAFDAAAEGRLFGKLGLLLESRAPAFTALRAARQQEREALLDAAAQRVAQLLIDAAALEHRGPADHDQAEQAQALRQVVREAETATVADLLALFRFELGAYEPPDLPIEQGRWALDLFDPEALRVLGIRTGSAVAAGAAAGVSVDAMLGGASLGAGAVIGAVGGTAWSLYQSWGRRWVDGWRGYRVLRVEEVTLALLAARQLGLLQALLGRGHASTAAVVVSGVQGWPDPALREVVLRARSHPAWSRLNGGEPDPGGRREIADALRRHLVPAVAGGR